MPVRVRAIRPRLDLAAVLETLGLSVAELHLDAFLVGGFVRDRLLGRENKDIDLVVVGSDGVPLLERVAGKLGWARPVVFERFATAQVRGGGFVLEVVQARAERYDPESRKPDVQPGSLEEDIARRDFTVNALAQRFDGRILDVTGRGLDCAPPSTPPTPSRRTLSGCSGRPGSSPSSDSASPTGSRRRCGRWHVGPPSSPPSACARSSAGC
jgi:predicted nucleotidyltransferase